MNSKPAKLSLNTSKPVLIRVVLASLFALLFFSLGYASKTYSPKNSPDDPIQGSPEASNSPVKEVPVKTDEAKLYEVIKVVDGDTVDVSIDGQTERLRLIGMDTPETVDPRKAVQCFGKEASNKAKELLDGKKVYLEADPTQGERDKYQRLLRYVFLEDHTSFERYMIENGYAHEYTYNLPYKYQSEYQQAEYDAREANRGLWGPTTCNGKP